MNKQTVVAISCFVLMIIAMTLFIVDNCKMQMDKFYAKAEVNLGTDDFEVWSYDGFLVAKTPDGRQYPPQMEVDKYFQNRLIGSIVPACVCGTFGFLLVIGAVIYERKKHRV